MLIILAVVLAASAMQSARGLEYLVAMAEKLLRKNPKYLTLAAPVVAWLFTFLAGTGHVVYSLLPVINELAIDNNIRPERPISNSIIASQQAITCSPMSAATAAMIGFMAPIGISFSQILMVTVPAALIGVIVTSVLTIKKGKELQDDPVFQQRLAAGLVRKEERKNREITRSQRLSVVIFLAAVLGVILLGLFPMFRPTWVMNGESSKLSMAMAIEIVMLLCACLIILACKPKVEEILSTNIFRSGALAIVCAFGLAWMSNTFVEANREFIEANVSQVVNTVPWLFAIVVFIVAALITSQGATTLIMIPIGIGLGLPPAIVLGAWMAVNANYFFPIASQSIAAISFDTAGTTKIGKYVLNHSFMVPGLLNTLISVVIATGLGYILL